MTIKVLTTACQGWDKWQVTIRFWKKHMHAVISSPNDKLDALTTWLFSPWVFRTGREGTTKHHQQLSNFSGFGPFLQGFCWTTDFVRIQSWAEIYNYRSFFRDLLAKIVYEVWVGVIFHNPCCNHQKVGWLFTQFNSKAYKYFIHIYPICIYLLCLMTQINQFDPLKLHHGSVL